MDLGHRIRIMGIQARRHIRRDETGRTAYCLKFDITKFYPSIDHDILKQIIRRKIKDARLLRLLDEIIDSAPAFRSQLPVGPSPTSPVVFRPLTKREAGEALLPLCGRYRDPGGR